VNALFLFTARVSLMNTLQPRDFLLFILTAVLSGSFLAGCQNSLDQITPEARNGQNGEARLTEPTSSRVDEVDSSDVYKSSFSDVNCELNAEHDFTRTMRARTTKEGSLVAVTREDTLGFVLSDVFSAPGGWTFINRKNIREALFEGADEPIEEDVLMYYCDDNSPEYPNCGKPESIGNPDQYESSEFIVIYFSYFLCNNTFSMSYYKDTQHNHPHAEEFLRYHGFPVFDTVRVEVAKLSL